MKKYNLSKVMRKAWEIKKENCKNIFSLCLRMAWKEEKEGGKMNRTEEIMKVTGLVREKAEIIEEAEKEEKKDFSKVKRTILNSNIGWTGDISVRLWESYGKKRIYFNDNRGRSCYIDAKTGNEVGVDAEFEFYVIWFKTMYTF